MYMNCSGHVRYLKLVKDWIAETTLSYENLTTTDFRQVLCCLITKFVCLQRDYAIGIISTKSGVQTSIKYPINQKVWTSVFKKADSNSIKT